MIHRTLALLTLALALLAPGLTLAQTEKRAPLGIAPPAAERGLTAVRPAAPGTPSLENAGLTTRLWAFVVEQQRRFSREMAAAVKQMRSEPFGPAFLSLAFLSFTYGVLHAAGPGHGKFVISSYALATERTMRRGILLSFIAAFLQALSAIALFLVLALVMRATKRQFDVAEAWLETLSWGLVALTGAWLMYRQVSLLRAASGPAGHLAHRSGHHEVATRPTDAHASRAHEHHAPEHHGHEHAARTRHDHDQDHDHHHDHHTCSHPGHTHAHHHDASCGHLHMPDPRQLEGQWSWGRAIALAASVGVRPCSGALIVLAFALLNGILWAGVLATFAMALGTAITVSALAALAVGSKQLATRIAGADSRWASRIAATAGIAAAAVVLVFGAAFFVASLKGIGPL